MPYQIKSKILLVDDEPTFREAYQELFEEHGGNTVQLVPSLNSNATWVNAVADIVIKNQSEK